MLEDKTLVRIKAVLKRALLLVGVGVWLPAANAEVVASLGDVELDADAVLRLLEQSDDAVVLPTQEQQREAIFQNLLRKFLAKQAEEAGLADQSEVAEQIRVLAEDAILYSAYLRSLVPVASLTTTQVVALYRANIENYQRPESISVNQILLTRAGYGSGFDDAVSSVVEAVQGDSLDFSDIDSDLGLGAGGQADAAVQRTIAVADLLPSVRQALADAEAGNVVGPISLTQGVVFVQLNERLPAGPRPFDEVEQSLRDQVARTLRSSSETAYVDGLVQANPIKTKSERSWKGWLEGKRLPRRPEKRVIAEMGDVEYSLGELLAFVEVLKASQFNQELLADAEFFREQIVRPRVIRKFLVAQARANNFGDQPKVRALIAEARRGILSDAWLAKLVDGAMSVPEELMIEKYYEENVADYSTPASVNISQLLIEAGDGVEAKVGEFVRSVEGDESSFKARARELSLEEGGVTSTFTEGWRLITDIPANVFQQIQGLSSGGLSAPITVPQGVMFIGINQVRRARVIPLEEIRERVESEYIAKQRIAERNRRVQELREAVIFPDFDG
jgi:parvulin-like peptidyl-prolyl isomerase